jgi:hypothetical protein
VGGPWRAPRLLSERPPGWPLQGAGPSPHAAEEVRRTRLGSLMDGLDCMVMSKRPLSGLLVACGFVAVRFGLLGATLIGRQHETSSAVGPPVRMGGRGGRGGRGDAGQLDASHTAVLPCRRRYRQVASPRGRQTSPLPSPLCSVPCSADTSPIACHALHAFSCRATAPSRHRLLLSPRCHLCARAA